MKHCVCVDPHAPSMNRTKVLHQLTQCGSAFPCGCLETLGNWDRKDYRDPLIIAVWKIPPNQLHPREMLSKTREVQVGGSLRHRK